MADLPGTTVIAAGERVLGRALLRLWNEVHRRLGGANEGSVMDATDGCHDARR
jgi:hypothetical protein